MPNRSSRSAAALGAVLVAVMAAGCGPPADDAPTTVEVQAAADGQIAPGAVWPSRDGASLTALQEQTDRGKRPDMVDPRSVARQYAATAMPGTGGRAGADSTVSGPFVPTGPSTGDVVVSGSGLSSSTVHLRRLERSASAAGPHAGSPIWYVQGVSAGDLAVVDVDYDARRLVASFVPTSDGTLTIRVTGLDGALLAEQVATASTERLVTVDVELPGHAALVVSATLVMADGTMAPREFRIGAPPPED